MPRITSCPTRPKEAKKTYKMRILQLNLNHCEAPQDLLWQTVRDIRIDVGILREQYKNLENVAWISDITGRACGRQAITEATQDSTCGFVWAMIRHLYLYSCYALPNTTTEEFQGFIDRIVQDARGRRPVVIAGEFNAWATEWGSQSTNRRGEILLEAFAKMEDLVLANTGSNPTLMRGGRSSVIDLTFVSAILLPTTNCQVSDVYIHSDHQAILTTIWNREPRVIRHERCAVRWKTRKFGRDRSKS
ncbi:uncharacterized protein [Halyomorpha halys]|uniref:uncharacterized protein n=1 Tax=Halyomorpha halys TaxID=286706 RepID=UPI0034D2C148